jgi:hypothetical protein
VSAGIFIVAGILLLEEPEVDYASEVLFVADHPGVFDALIVDIEHIDVKGVFVVGQEDAVTAAGGPVFVIAEFRVEQINIGSGGDGYGIFADDDCQRFYCSMGDLAIVAAVIGMAVDAQQVLFGHHKLVFRGAEDAGADGNQDIIILEGLEIEAEVLNGELLQLGFADALVQGSQGEGGYVIADIGLADLVEVVFFTAKVGIIEVLGHCREAAQRKEEEINQFTHSSID